MHDAMAKLGVKDQQIINFMLGVLSITGKKAETTPMRDRPTTEDESKRIEVSMREFLRECSRIEALPPDQATLEWIKLSEVQLTKMVEYQIEKGTVKPEDKSKRMEEIRQSTAQLYKNCFKPPVH